MVKQLIKKLTYPGLVLSFAVGNAVGLGTKLGLLNPPLGLAVAGIGFGAAIVGGIVHAPKIVPASGTVTPKKSPLNSVVNGARNWIGFFFDTVKTPGYVVGASAAQGGYNLLFQATMGISMCMTAAWLSPALVPVAIGGCVALGGVALFSIAGGIDEQFKGVGEFFHNRFNKDVPIDPSKKNLIQKFVARPSVQKLVQQPVMQKFLNTGMVKALRKGPSPKVKKILLTCMAVETSIFSLYSAVTVLTSGPAVIPLVIAGGWAASASWGIIQAARDTGLLKHIQILGKKQTIAPGSAPAAQFAPAPVANKRSLFTKVTQPLTNIFKKSANRQYAGGNIFPKFIGTAKFQPQI